MKFMSYKCIGLDEVMPSNAPPVIHYKDLTLSADLSLPCWPDRSSSPAHRGPHFVQCMRGFVLPARLQCEMGNRAHCISMHHSLMPLPVAPFLGICGDIQFSGNFAILFLTNLYFLKKHCPPRPSKLNISLHFQNLC